MQLQQSANSKSAFVRPRFSCVIGIDSRGVITDANEGAERLLAAPAQLLVGQDVRLYLAGNAKELFMLRALQEGNVYLAGVEEILVRGIVHRLWSTTVSVAETGRPTRVICTFAEPEPGVEVGIAQQENEDLVGRVLAAVAHEIRNPLAAIKGSAQLLTEEGEGYSANARLANIIAEQADRVEHVIHSFLALSGNTGGPAGSVAVVDLLSEAKRHLDSLARSKNIEVHTASDPDLPAVTADRSQLLDVVLNLARNALQAAPANSRVEVKAVLDGDEIAFSVTDDRRGFLSPEERERLAEPFFAIKTLGIDIGLAAGRRLVARHGGRIEVTSKAGKGCTFSVVLPTSPAGVA